MGGCPRCGSEGVTIRRAEPGAAGLRDRRECAGCGRLIGYAEPNGNVSTESPPAAGLAVTPGPPEWLYVSKRLDLILLPNTRLFSAPVVAFGDRVYYRASPIVYWWLVAAGEAMAARLPAGPEGQAQARTIADGIAAVGRFLEDSVGVDAVEAARTPYPDLPKLVCPEP